MNERPYAIAVRPLDNYRLSILFSNNENRIFDVKPYIRGAWFGELSDEEIFRKVRIGRLSVEWPNGQDICPDELYYDSVLV